MDVTVVAEQVLAPVPGGTARYALGLIAALANTAVDGDRISATSAWHRNVTPARVSGVPGPRRLPLPRRLLTAAWEYRRGPAPRRADLVHAPTLLIPPKRGRGLVVTVHDAVPWTHPETLTARGVRWHLHMASVAAQEADAVVVPTQAVRQRLGEVLPELDAARVHVIPPGVTQALTDPDPRVIADLALPDRYLLSLATLEPRKGLDVLLAALAEPGAPDIPLVVVGQLGWGDVDLEGQAKALGLAGRVLELGRLPDRQLAAVLAGATALVMPSRAEGFGLPLLEAMAAGVPAVTSDDPALVEVGGGAAVVAPREDRVALAEALARVCGDEGLRATMAYSGRARAEGFSWDACGRRLWALYARIIDGRG